MNLFIYDLTLNKRNENPNKTREKKKNIYLELKTLQSF